METKICSCCGEEKELILFPFRKDTNSYRKECKKCVSIYSRKLYQSNIDIRKKKSALYYENNREKINYKRRKEYNDNIDVNLKVKNTNKNSRIRNHKNILKGKKQYRENNKEAVRKSRRLHKINHPEYYASVKYKLTQSLRARIRQTVIKGYKSTSSMELVGCSIEFLRNHLEKKFRNGMSWENYGIKGWHIDHIRPCASFDLTDPKQQKQCFHYTNLQPLWYWENCSKSDSLNYQISQDILATSA